jgi:hypothetical protein
MRNRGISAAGSPSMLAAEPDRPVVGFAAPPPASRGCSLCSRSRALDRLPAIDRAEDSPRTPHETDGYRETRPARQLAGVVSAFNPSVAHRSGGRCTRPRQRFRLSRCSRSECPLGLGPCESLP